MIKEFVWEYLPEFAESLEAQLKKDEKRWGDTWKKRVHGGQEERIYALFATYYDQWKNASNPIPWLKVAGLAMIAWIRDGDPEEFSVTAPPDPPDIPASP